MALHGLTSMRRKEKRGRGRKEEEKEEEEGGGWGRKGRHSFPPCFQRGYREGRRHPYFEIMPEMFAGTGLQAVGKVIQLPSA